MRQNFTYVSLRHRLERGRYTERLVTTALKAGFCGIDTANQRKHYHEAGVGAALRVGVCESGLRRDESLFIQTKFTHRDLARTIDSRTIPNAKDRESRYGSRSSARSRTSQIEVVDSYMLHGPKAQKRSRARKTSRRGTSWRSSYSEGRVRMLGVSNVTPSKQLALLCEKARVRRPRWSSVGRRASAGWDKELRRRGAGKHGVDVSGVLAAHGKSSRRCRSAA